MADRYDNEPRNTESRRGGRSEREDDRQNFGQDQSGFQNRGRNQMWNDYRDEDRGRTDNQQRDWRDNETPHNQRDWSVREPAWENNRPNFDRERTGHEGPFGTGSQGFGTGYRSGEFSSRYSSGGTGSYTGYGASGQESYYGGSGSYGRGAPSSMGSSVSSQERGRFSGKGPKGYQRSDDRIREDVCERLTHHPEIDASEIDVKVSNGEVTLTGTVEERQAKRMAEEVAENISGVKDVHNQVRVKSRDMGMEGKETKEMTGGKSR